MSTHMYTHDRSAEELLHAYIDNELENDLEQQFFSLLATDEDLRTRLRQLRAIRGEALRFGAVAGPTPALTQTVFDRLGFAPPPDAARPARRPIPFPLFGKAWAPVAAAAVAAFITFLLMSGMPDRQTLQSSDGFAQAPPGATETPFVTPTQPAKQSPSGEYTQAGTRKQHGKQEQPATPGQFTTHQRASAPVSQATREDADAHITATNRSTQIAGMTGNESAEHLNDLLQQQAPHPGNQQHGTSAGAYDAATIAATHIPSGTDALPGPGEQSRAVGNDDPDGASGHEGMPVRDDDAQATATHALPSVLTVPMSDPSASSHVLAQNTMPATALAQEREGVDTRRYFPDLDGISGFHSFSLEVRGVSAASFPEVTIGTESNPWMENMALALYYGTTSNDYGVEFGQEAFSQHYDGVEYGKRVEYQQNLLTSWILAGYRHRFGPVHSLASIEPYVTTGFGATVQAWPMLRAGAGIMYMPDSKVRFHIGFEGSLLAFPFQEKWFTSKRAGMTYGISLLL